LNGIHMKPTILFLSRKWPPAVGGMETHAFELFAGLSEVADVHPLVLAGRPDGRAPGLLAYAAFLLKAMVFCTWHARKFERLILCDLILFPTAVLHRCLNPGARRIVYVHGLDLVYQQRSGLLPWVYGGYLRAFRASQACFSRIVANSRHTRELAEQQGLRDVVVINPSLPSSSFPEHDTTAALPLAWEEAKGTHFRILYFGRLIPRKGALWFAGNVMPMIAERARFYVVGDSSLHQYKAELAACARTHLLGRVDSPRLATMIRQADVVVMPNVAVSGQVDVEGFGLVAIETTALGGRLLAARIDGISDAVVDGITGRLLPSGDAEVWASLLEQSRTPGTSVFPDADSAATETRTRYACSIQAQAFMALLDPSEEQAQE